MHCYLFSKFDSVIIIVIIRFSNFVRILLIVLFKDSMPVSSLVPFWEPTPNSPTKFRDDKKISFRPQERLQYVFGYRLRTTRKHSKTFKESCSQRWEKLQCVFDYRRKFRELNNEVIYIFLKLYSVVIVNYWNNTKLYLGIFKSSVDKFIRSIPELLGKIPGC